MIVVDKNAGNDKGNNKEKLKRYSARYFGIEDKVLV